MPIAVCTGQISTERGFTMIATHNIKVNGVWVQAGEKYDPEKRKPEELPEEEPVKEEPKVEEPEAEAEPEKEEPKPKRTTTRRKKISE